MLDTCLRQFFYEYYAACIATTILHHRRQLIFTTEDLLRSDTVRDPEPVFMADDN
jgi:hypothetical protein